MQLKNKSKCRICRNPSRQFKTTCSIGCETELGMRLLEKKKRADAKQVRAVDKIRKEKLKSRSDWVKDAQIAFNAYIRARDRLKTCICCGRPLASDAVGGGFDCGHYRSVGSAPHMRFNEDNAHGQTKQCNRYGAGRAVDYRIGLIMRLGIERVEAIESNNETAKWTIDDLKQIKEKYKRKLKEIVK